MLNTPPLKFIRTVSFCAVSLISCELFCNVSNAADFRGAEAIIRQAQEAVEKAQGNTNDPGSQFRADLKAFTADSKNLSPADAAKQWLALYDRFECFQYYFGILKVVEIGFPD